MRFRYAILTVVSMVASLALSAAQGAPNDSYSKCTNATSTNTDWAQCGSAEIARQEARLGAAWKKAFACFDVSDDKEKATKQSFLEEQRAWIKWKDAACSVYGSGYEGREGQVLSFPMCKADIISNRTKWLEGFAKGENGEPCR